MDSKYDEITARIIVELDRGTAPWSKPWICQAPINAASGKQYQGINKLLLGMAGYPDNRWVTFKQSLDLGGNVKRGERGTQIVFWQFIDANGKDVDDQQKERRIPLCRIYTVFNASQCERLLASDGGKLRDMEPISKTGDGSAIKSARQLMENMPKPPHVQKSDHAAYVPLRDTILMPDACTFQSEEGFFLAFAHEICHATGHSTRLNRPAVTGTVKFGSDDYSEEELIAELGACFICAEFGVTNDIENSASYLDHWRRRLSTDSRLIVRASSAAQKAADWVFGRRADSGGELVEG